jgi:hypothetical protein
VLGIEVEALDAVQIVVPPELLSPSPPQVQPRLDHRDGCARSFGPNRAQRRAARRR